jgi:general stress protein 26
MATRQLSAAEKQAHLVELIRDFDTAMLVTRTADGSLRSRPLAIAEVVAEGDGDGEGYMYFATSIESGKVHEVEDDAHVNVVLQDGKRFVSISGVARIVRDRALIDRLYSEAWKVWFPKGKGDPTLALLEVDATAAEYWDQSGAKGLAYLYEAVTAYVKGRRPHEADEMQNAKIDL